MSKPEVFVSGFLLGTIFFGILIIIAMVCPSSGMFKIESKTKARQVIELVDREVRVIEIKMYNNPVSFNYAYTMKDHKGDYLLRGDGSIKFNLNQNAEWRGAWERARGTFGKPNHVWKNGPLIVMEVEGVLGIYDLNLGLRQGPFKDMNDLLKHGDLKDVQGFTRKT